MNKNIVIVDIFELLFKLSQLQNENGYFVFTPEQLELVKNTAEEINKDIPARTMSELTVPNFMVNPINCSTTRSKVTEMSS